MTMPADELPLLRGRILRSDRFWNPRGGDAGRPPRLPSRDPAAHRDFVAQQLDALSERVESRPEDARVPEATREIIAVRPEIDAEMRAGGLADKRSDIRLISVDEDTGAALIDAPSADLTYLRRKIEQFADDEKITPKGSRRNEALVAPIGEVGEARLDETGGTRFRSDPPPAGEPRWFEIACRGGSRYPAEESDNARAQIHRVVVDEFRHPEPQEFQASERLMFYLRLTRGQLARLHERTDCIYEFDLVAPEIRDWLTRNAPPVMELQSFALTPPPADAPCVVLLDTGVARRHPMLENAILSATCSVPGETSPEDTHGHGTEMAGVALYDDVGSVVDANGGVASHWLQSSRILVSDGVGSASEENRPYWPATTLSGIETAEMEDATDARRRAFVLAVSSELGKPGRPTGWSAAMDEIAYCGGEGRLLMVAIGSPIADVSTVEGYPRASLQHLIHDPAQASNVLTVGAYTERAVLPLDLPHHQPVAPPGGISPYTTSGIPNAAIKPELVLEGGNSGFDGVLPETTDTMVQLTTGHDFLVNPLSSMWGTSSATAIAGRLAAMIWAREPDLRPETVRALLVHSARWTDTMLGQLPDLDERLRLCGYGVPDVRRAMSCVQERATVVIEDSMPNAILDEENKPRRALKLFRLPIPSAELEALGDAEVELSVTLSYFAEPNYVRRTSHHGLDLEWDMQGVAESELEFLQRINRAQREQDDVKNPGTSSFDWEIRKRRRGRGTVQSDRWRGPASLLAGSKLIGVYPLLGWWNDRKDLIEEKMRFALVITVSVPDGVDIYTPISQSLAVSVDIDVT